MTDRPYCWRKVFEAALTLASSDKPLQERLASAYVHSLRSLTDSGEDFYGMTPEEQKRFREIIRPFEEYDGPFDPNEGSAIAAARTLDDFYAHMIAEEIVVLFNSIAQRSDE